MWLIYGEKTVMEVAAFATCYRSTTVYKHPGVPELEKKKLNKTTKKRDKTVTFFSWKSDISVINLFIEDFKAELTHRLVRLVTETPTPGFVLMV